MSIYKFDFVVRNLNSDYDSDWIDLINSSEEDITQEWYSVVSRNHDFEIVDIDTNLDIDYYSIQYANLESLFKIKNFLDKKDNVFDALIIQSHLYNGYSIFEIIEKEETEYLFDTHVVEVPDDNYDTLAHALEDELGGFDISDYYTYFDYGAFGRDSRLIFGIDELENDTLMELDDYELGEYVVDNYHGRIEFIPDKEWYIDYERLGRDLALDYTFVEFERDDTGDITYAWVRN